MKVRHIVIAGAGSVGCFVGGLLTAAGKRVSFLARPRIAEELGTCGLHLTDIDGLDVSLPAERLDVATDASVLSAADLVLVTVKSSATEEIARLIDCHVHPGATVVSLQNGTTNAPMLRTLLPSHHRVLAGMVPFNVLHRGEGRFHRGTSGDIVIESDAAGTAAAITVPHLQVEASNDMEDILWGKLVLNLNNALNALSGLPLRDQLLDRRWRVVLARQQAEALAILGRAGIRPRSISPLPLSLLPWLLRLPTPLFRVAANSAIRIDPLARSSMWEDLQRGRPTEIDELQGAIVRLAERQGTPAPIAKRILRTIRKVEQTNTVAPINPADLLK